ncbi:hypothetical protein H311_04214 [Anncaliia algerae PRA109]|nr:hypothetical protein H311_04214 [Anncaliia algerae PRA109]
MKLEDFEDKIIKMTNNEMIKYLMTNNFIKSYQICQYCSEAMKLCIDKMYKDFYSFRCKNNNCVKHGNRCSIRKNSFFEDFSIEFTSIIKVLIRWCVEQQNYSIIQFLNISKTTVSKIIDKLIELLKKDNRRIGMFGGPFKLVQIDETMMNFKVKSHRGRSSKKKTDALTIVECDQKITKVLACVIKDKKESTILPIIKEHVLPGSIVHTDEHASYKNCAN